LIGVRQARGEKSGRKRLGRACPKRDQCAYYANACVYQVVDKPCARIDKRAVELRLKSAVIELLVELFEIDLAIILLRESLY
jgi:hypothetical protein